MAKPHRRCGQRQRGSEPSSVREHIPQLAWAQQDRHAGSRSTYVLTGWPASQQMPAALNVSAGEFINDSSSDCVSASEPLRARLLSSQRSAGSPSYCNSTSRVPAGLPSASRSARRAGTASGGLAAGSLAAPTGRASALPVWCITANRTRSRACRTLNSIGGSPQTAAALPGSPPACAVAVRLHCPATDTTTEALRPRACGGTARSLAARTRTHKRPALPAARASRALR
mmetsp:Transcript_95425/g.291867  ORF Transcript_95425/g.291867 Transcript_95425/m.291867 type:complete len:229 (-) Transcript_95425:1325-2011(-)